MSSEILIKELPWPEVEKLFKKGIAIIPIGATEQHGPHLPLGADSYYAYEIAKKVGKMLKIAVLPTLEYSVSGYNMQYPTITIEPENLINYLKDICKSLKKFKVDRIIFIVGHGGENTFVMKTACYIISRDFDIETIPIFPWEFADEKYKNIIKKDWHAGYLETSDMLFINERLVKKERIKKSKLPKPLFWYLPYNRMKRDKSKGVYGNPENASIEVGKENIEKIVKNIVKFIKTKLLRC